MATRTNAAAKKVAVAEAKGRQLRLVRDDERPAKPARKAKAWYAVTFAPEAGEEVVVEVRPGTAEYRRMQVERFVAKHGRPPVFRRNPWDTISRDEMALPVIPRRDCLRRVPAPATVVLVCAVSERGARQVVANMRRRGEVSATAKVVSVVQDRNPVAPPPFGGSK